AGITKVICVGTSGDSSERAVKFASRRPNVYSSVGAHPHDAKDGYDKIEAILAGTLPKRLVAVGEIGLDYFYTYSPREIQLKAFEAQLDLALKHDLPVIFHVRDAFDDFWPIFDNFKGIKGVLHSFTDSKDNLNEALKRNLYIGVNGISTFTKN